MLLFNKFPKLLKSLSTELCEVGFLTLFESGCYLIRIRTNVRLNLIIDYEWKI